MRLRIAVLSVLASVLVFAGCETMADSMDDEPMMDDESMMEAEESMDESMSDSDMMSATEFQVTIQVRADSGTPLAPVAWAVHTGANPFVAGDMGKLGGLEALAEDGDPSGTGDALEGIERVTAHGIVAIPDGASSAGPATPGHSYSFTFEASEGQHLSFATMYVQSNDLFYSPSADGLALWDMSAPKEGDITSMVVLYDAGTERNERPGRGENQPPRQSGPNTGPSENRPVRPISEVQDGFSYPATRSVITVTIQPTDPMGM